MTSAQTILSPTCAYSSELYPFSLILKKQSRLMMKQMLSFIPEILNQRTTKPTIRSVGPAGSDQPVHPPSMQCFCRRHMWSAKTLVRLRGAQADPSFRWSHKSNCRFCHALTHYYYFCLVVSVNTNLSHSMGKFSRSQTDDLFLCSQKIKFDKQCKLQGPTRVGHWGCVCGKGV